MKNIITNTVRDFRDVRVMMLSTHESHNENVWDFEAPRKLACRMFKDPIDVIFNITVFLFKNIPIGRNLEGKKA